MNLASRFNIRDIRIESDSKVCTNDAVIKGTQIVEEIRSLAEYFLEISWVSHECNMAALC